MKLNNSPVTMPSNPEKVDMGIKKSTDAFEAIFVKRILDVAYKNSSIGGTGPGKEIIKGMYLDELSKSSNGTMGISKMLYNNLIEGKMK